MKQKFFSVLALVVLSSCGGSSSSKDGNGGNNLHTISEDTPQTRLTAVRNDPDFSALIQTPECDAQTRTVTSVVYEARLNVRTETIGGAFFCPTEVKVLIDSRTGLLMWWQDCDQNGSQYVHTRAISDYSISAAGFIKVGDFASIDRSWHPESFFFGLQGAPNGDVLSRSPRKELKDPENQSLYSFFCQGR
jgi:hypothetical protein